MSYAEMMKQAKKPFEDGFPFGSFLVELKQLEIKTEKGQKGEYKTFWYWHLLITKRRHESAQGSEGAILKLRRDFNTDFGITDNTSLAASLCGKTFDEYQALPDAVIDAYIPDLQDEKTCSEKHRQMILEVAPDNKGYRRYHAYTTATAPTTPFIFDPATVVQRVKEDETDSAAAKAATGTATKPSIL